MLLSVVIPVYNASAWLRECMDSCLAQDMDDMEVVCVDDGSTDDSLDILRAYERQDGRVRILHLPENAGLHMARKRGAAVARGKYILCVDADDRISPWDGCRKLVAFAEKARAEMVLFPVKGFADSQDAHSLAWVKHVDQMGCVAEDENVPFDAYARSLYAERQSLTCSGGKLFLADAFRSVMDSLPEGYCNMGEDAIRLYAFLGKARAIASTNNALVYEYRGGSGMSTGGGRGLAARCGVLRSVAFVSKCLAGVVGPSYRREFHEAVVQLGMKRALFDCSVSDLICVAHAGLSAFVGEDRDLFLGLAVKDINDKLQVEKDLVVRLRRSKRLWRTLFFGAMIVSAIVVLSCIP